MANTPIQRSKVDPIIPLSASETETVLEPDKGALAKGAIPDEEQLGLQICLPGYHINRSNKLVLESKSDLAQRGEASPDDADGFAFTFAQPVVPIEAQQQEPVLYDIFVDGFSGLGGGWMR
jgi:hypothetical protein